jgi:uncharacterized protein with NAD-binding domain and iron-sulfur cluster
VRKRADNARKAVRVANVGGGCAGLAAAWHLSRQSGYEVHVYEKSWRLGGKGASGRDQEGRIQEHGLHVWLGFYENAFRMMRECYAEVGRRKWGPGGQTSEARLAHASFEDAFFPEPHIGVAGRNSSRDWVVWSGQLPPAKGLPGDDLVPETNPFTLASYLLRCVDLLKTLMLSVIGPTEEDVPGKPRPEQRSTLDEMIDLDFSYDPIRSPELLIERIASRVRDGTLTVAAAALQAVTIAEVMLQNLNQSPQVVGSALNLMQALAGQARKQLRDFVAIDETLRWKTEIIDIVMTIAVGLYSDRVLLRSKGLDAINDMDYREWLLKHGATKTAVNSRFISGIYDFLFAYEGGDHKRPRLAAGVALRGALRMFFTYRGAMFWRIRSGMGDAVFAPLYKVMLLEDKKAKAGNRQPPVKFHFLHALSEVTLETRPGGKRFVTELRFRTDGDENKLDELSAKALDDFGCWPDSRRAFDDHAGSGWTGGRDLKIEKDFDAVIFAMGIDDLKRVGARRDKGQPATSFFEAMPRDWRDMGREVKTVGTKAAQVWLAKDLEGLGWYRGSGLISALGLRFDTWADMTHTLATERAWRKALNVKSAAADKARSVAYFCGVLPDDEAKKGAEPVTRGVEADLQAMLAREIQPLWPAAFPEAFKDRTAEGLVIGARHVQASIEGSDRYTLSLPGSPRRRISPLECPVRNMTIAGDWTACGLDVGCVEAAVISGMLAAHAITGDEPALESIIGYDHP